MCIIFVCTGAERGKDEQPDSSVAEKAYSYGPGKVYLHQGFPTKIHRGPHTYQPAHKAGHMELKQAAI